MPSRSDGYGNCTAVVNGTADDNDIFEPSRGPMAGSRVRDASPALRAAGKLCIEVAPTSKMAWISEELCIGCGICVKVCVACCWPFGDSVDRFRSSRAQKCPFEAIMIINLPKNLEAHTTHRYGANTFKLHRFPFST